MFYQLDVADELSDVEPEDIKMRGSYHKIPTIHRSIWVDLYGANDIRVYETIFRHPHLKSFICIGTSQKLGYYFDYYADSQNIVVYRTFDGFVDDFCNQFWWNDFWPQDIIDICTFKAKVPQISEDELKCAIKKLLCGDETV